MRLKRILKCIIRFVGLFIEGNQNLKKEKNILTKFKTKMYIMEMNMGM